MTEPTAGENAYRLLREALKAGRYAPGQRLVEPDVMADLGVTRLALREAFARLEHEGLVDRRANKGAAVRLLTRDEALEVLEIRSVVEGLAARHAAANATPADVAALRETIAAFERALDDHDISVSSAAQARLHRLVLDLGRRPTAARLAEMLSTQSAQTRLRTSLVGGRLRESLDEHRAIVAAIAAGDPETAESEMRRHLAQVMRTVTSEP
ncbi:MAG: GntR family transcriptional regulator [Streptosporangiales bacterium]|nr:GntR family transcriptional regulator [Streptosporangiales bacterium]MBO0891343.1 GntR family transcriptional regulator [Acidothermales bacterium]